MREQGVFQAKLLLSWVRGVRQNKNKKSKRKTQRTKTTKKESKRKERKRKRKNQSSKDRRRAKENRKEKQVLWTRRCLNNVQNCRKKREKSNSNLVKTPGGVK